MLDLDDLHLADGKAEYCYANCAGMLLASIGEGISPATIEVLTAVGIGAPICRPGGKRGTVSPS